MDKIYDIRDAETNKYLGTVETTTPFDAAIIHFAVYGTKISEIEIISENPFVVAIENKRYNIIEDLGSS